MVPQSQKQKDFIDGKIYFRQQSLKDFIADSKRSLLTEIFTAIDYFDSDKKSLMSTVEKLISIEYAYLCHNLDFVCRKHNAIKGYDKLLAYVRGVPK